MAVEHGDMDLLLNLGEYYHEIKDYENMLKYYLMGIENGNTDVISNLMTYYTEQKDYENMLKYLFMDIQKNDGDKDYMEEAVEHLHQSLRYNKQVTDKLVEMVINDKKTIDLSEQKNIQLEQKISQLEKEITHLKYIPGGPGYQDAKNNFETNSKINI